MDARNPSVVSQTSLSPADLAKVAKNPALLTETSRKMLAVQLMTMHNRMSDPNIPIGQRQAWMEFLAKVGDVMPKPQAAPVGAGSGFTVQIVLTDPAQQPAKAQVVDVEAQQIEGGDNGKDGGQEREVD